MTDFGMMLTWVLSEGGAMALSYVLMDKIGFLRDLAAEAKRLVSFALAAVLAILAYGVSIAMEYQPVPIDTRAWIETLVSVALVAIMGSQLIHGRRDLSKR